MSSTPKNAELFCSILKKQGFDFFIGVPCSILSKIILHMSVDRHFTYISATREDEALGIAAGAYMGGKKPVVLMQNSGIGQSINALTSLILLYKIPVLILISWRGYQGKDEPEHLYMGRYLTDFLTVMKIPYFILERESVENQIAKASELVAKGDTVAIILRKGVLE